jgi:hypothetical protein
LVAIRAQADIMGEFIYPRFSKSHM